MPSVELTPAFLDRLRGLAQNCQPPIWDVNEHSDVISVAHKVAEVAYDEDAQFIAAADPATVLALLDELTDVRMALLELAWEFYGRDQTREEIESCCAVMVENERASRKESEAGQ